MKPADKYMSEVKSINNEIKFIPPSFDRNFLMDNYMNENDTSNDFLDLYPDETNESTLYCYYNSLNNCSKKQPPKDSSKKRNLPDIFEVLKELNFNADEMRGTSNSITDDISLIYSKIKNNNPEINKVLSSYNIPDPISKVITEDLIKLSLLYFNESR